MTVSDLRFPLATELQKQAYCTWQTVIVCTGSPARLSPACLEWHTSTACSSSGPTQISWNSASEMHSRVWMLLWWKKTILKFCRISPCRKRVPGKLGAVQHFSRFPSFLGHLSLLQGMWLRNACGALLRRKLQMIKSLSEEKEWCINQSSFWLAFFMHANQPITYIYAHFMVLRPGAIFYQTPELHRAPIHRDPVTAVKEWKHKKSFHIPISSVQMHQERYTDWQTEWKHWAVM